MDGATFSSNSYVRLQTFTATGVRVGTEVTVPNEGSNIQSAPVVTSLSDGRFVVTWTDRLASASADLGSYIRAQVYTAAGVASGDDFVVNAENRYNQDRPTVTELADGRIAFAWADGSQTGGDISGDAVRGQIFDPRIKGVQVTGTAGADRYEGSRFGDRMSGGAGGDVLTGNAGNDVLDGGAGTDRMVGGAGDDTFRIDRTTDVVTEAVNGGIDTVVSAGLSISLETRANVENATLDGTSTAAGALMGNTLANRLTGNNAANAISGSTGNDTLVGYGGADDLRGGAGVDRMSGGSGADDFIFTAASHIGKGATSDRIYDFAVGSDDIQLDFMAGGRFIGAAGFSGVDNQVRYVRSTGILSGDTNGDKVADWELVIVNKVALTAADIEF
jgi:Ca2+-binding RTX toxin-like protein